MDRCITQHKLIEIPKYDIISVYSVFDCTAYVDLKRNNPLDELKKALHTKMKERNIERHNTGLTGLIMSIKIIYH